MLDLVHTSMNMCIIIIMCMQDTVAGASVRMPDAAAAAELRHSCDLSLRPMWWLPATYDVVRTLR